MLDGCIPCAYVNHIALFLTCQCLACVKCMRVMPSFFPYCREPTTQQLHVQQETCALGSAHDLQSVTMREWQHLRFLVRLYLRHTLARIR